MSDTDGPWSDSDAARAIGPIELVRGPSRRQIVGSLFWGLFLGCAAPFCVGTMLFLACSGLPPQGRQGKTLEPFFWLYLIGWVCFAGYLVYWGDRRLSWRLLLGRHGVAIWGPYGANHVLWDDLGVRWHLVSLPGEQPGSITLARSDGDRFVITGYFADHDRVVRRVLEELARRVGARDPRSASPASRQDSDGITPAEHGVGEPEE